MRPPGHPPLHEQLAAGRRVGADHAVVDAGHRGHLRQGPGDDLGRHGGVAGGRLGRVRDADDLAEVDGELHQRLHVRGALGVVGVEQGDGGTAAQHQVELPGEVGGVTQAGAHALPGERRRLVGGVPGQQDPAVVPPLHPPGLEPVHGVALERGVAGVHVPRRQQLPGGGLGVELVEGLAGQAHELPAPTAGSARHQRGGAGRIADLQVDRIEHPGLVEHDVDDQPVVEVAEVAHRGVEQGAHGRAGTVGAHHEAGPQRGLVAGGRERGRPAGAGVHRLDGAMVHGDALAVLGQTDDLDAAADLHAGQGAGAPVEPSLQGRLVEHRRLGPAGQAGADAAEPQQHLARGVAPLVHLGGLADAGQVVAEPTGLQDPSGLVVEVHGPRQRVGRGPPLQDDHPVPVAGQQDGGSGAHRAVADDRHIRIDGRGGPVGPVTVDGGRSGRLGGGRLRRCRSHTPPYRPTVVVATKKLPVDGVAGAAPRSGAGEPAADAMIGRWAWHGGGHGSARRSLRRPGAAHRRAAARRPVRRARPVGPCDGARSVGPWPWPARWRWWSCSGGERAGPRRSSPVWWRRRPWSAGRACGCGRRRTWLGSSARPRRGPRPSVTAVGRPGPQAVPGHRPTGSDRVACAVRHIALSRWAVRRRCGRVSAAGRPRGGRGGRPSCEELDHPRRSDPRPSSGRRCGPGRGRSGRGRGGLLHR